MSNLYDILSSLCDEKGITGYRMCRDLGIQPSIMTDLKMGRRSGLKADTAQKIAEYFGVSVGYLLGTEQKEKAPAQEGERISDAELKFALWGDTDIDDSVLEDVKRFAKFAEENRKNGK